MKDNLPSIKDLYKVTLEMLCLSGGSASNREIETMVANKLQLTAKQLAIPRGDKYQNISRFYHRLAWSRSHLKMARYINNTKQGTWTLTEKGQRQSAVISSRQLQEDVRNHIKALLGATPVIRKQIGLEELDVSNIDDFMRLNQEACQQQLINKLNSISPRGFEKLCCLVLRESGLQDVQVSGQSGDGGVDGRGVILVNGLVGFKVAWQCKRYSSAIGSPLIRDFRGAIEGQTDKGLFMSTSHFTPSAQQEAVKPGGNPD